MKDDIYKGKDKKEAKDESSRILFPNNVGSSNNISQIGELSDRKYNKNFKNFEDRKKETSILEHEFIVTNDNNSTRIMDENLDISRNNKDISPLNTKLNNVSSLDFLDNSYNNKFLRGESENSFKQQIMNEKFLNYVDFNLLNKNLNNGTFNSLINYSVTNPHLTMPFPNNSNIINHNNFEFEMDNKLNAVKANSRLIIKEDNLVDEMYANKSSFRKFSDKKSKENHLNSSNTNDFYIPNFFSNPLSFIEKNNPNIFNFLPDDKKMLMHKDEMVFRDNLLKTISNKKMNISDNNNVSVK